MNFTEELFGLTGLRAAVVGGTGVLGSRFAETLSRAGAEVIVLGRSHEAGVQVVSKIKQRGGISEFIKVDVQNKSEILSAVEKIQALGGVDILVNAPGLNSATPFKDLSEEEWNLLIEVNLTSVFRLCQAFAPIMSGRPRGASIINISSSSSGPPLTRVMAYGVSKAGLNNLTQYLSRELAEHGIRVNAVVPGFFPAEQNRKLLSESRITDIKTHTPLKRLGEPKELDGVIHWLASPSASSFVTGSLVRVDGGFSAMSI